MKKNTKSTEDYLEAIYILQEEAKTSDVHYVRISDFLKVSRPAVTKAMNELVDKKYAIKKEYGTISLTNDGLKIAIDVYHKHVTIKKYLISIGVDEETAETDCCLIEHVISKKTFRALEKELIKK